MVKNLPANAGAAGDMGSIPGSGRSPGEGNGAHCSFLAWRIPWTKEPGVYSPWDHTTKRLHTHPILCTSYYFGFISWCLLKERMNVGVWKVGLCCP